MDIIRAAVIGAGQIARVSHLPAYRSAEGVQVVGVSDVRPESARKLAEDFSIPAYFDDHRKMLEQCRPDVVSVCVPNRFHHVITLDALRAGAHVLCEKPPAMNVREAEEMAQTARAQGRLLSYGFHLRHGENVRILKDIIDRGGLGRIYAADVQWLRRRGVPGWGVFTDKSMQGGGPLIDIGAHALDLAVYLMGYPEVDYVCADMFNAIGTTGRNGFFGSWDPERYTVEDALFGQIRFRTGAVMKLSTSFALNMKEKDRRQVTLYGDKKGADLFPPAVYSGDDGPAWNQTYPFEPAEDLHTKEIHAFVAACRGERDLLVTAEQGVYVQKLIAALYASAESKKPVFC